MNRRTKFLLCAGMAVLLIASVIWWLLRESPRTGPNIATTPAPENVYPTPEPQASPPSSERRPSPQQRQTEGGKFGGLATFSAVPIEFFGKVIDQDGKPLPDVEVIGGTGSTTGFMQQETRTYTTATDGNGLFTFKGFRGDALIIDLKKPGYNFESNRVRFHYSPIDPDKKRFTPERESPVVFQMWKSLGAEPLIHYKARSIRVPADGTPIKIDLAKGKKVDAGGDLLLSVTWGQRDDPGSYLFDWSVKLEVPEGGIVEGDGDVKFFAPADGYQSSVEHHFTAQERKSALQKAYYVKSKNGEAYSRVELSLESLPVEAASRVNLRVWLNPSGSRNLEYDPSKQVGAR